jgi:hypothetical protein
MASGRPYSSVDYMFNVQAAAGMMLSDDGKRSNVLRGPISKWVQLSTNGSKVELM